jgi:hypothetical protein
MDIRSPGHLMAFVGVTIDHPTARLETHQHVCSYLERLFSSPPGRPGPGSPKPTAGSSNRAGQLPLKHEHPSANLPVFRLLCGDRFRVAVLPYSSAMIYVMYSVQSQL